MKNRKGFIKGALTGALTMLLIIIALLGVGSVIDLKTRIKLEVIQNLIHREFLYSEEIDEEILRENVIKGYVDGLGDPYSVYYNEEETLELMEKTNGEFTGIGVVITQDPDTKYTTILNVYENSPGEKAGLQVGDIFYKVDGEEILTLDIDHVVSKLRGEEGTKVNITVLRGEGYEEFETTATRAVIENKSVEYEMKENKIGYLAVSGFEGNTFSQFKNAIEDLQNQGMEGLVIDLRNNPGGNLSTVCDMADYILPEGLIVYTQERDGDRDDFYSRDKHQLDLPLVVLINGNSASASEIFAGAVQDYEWGTIVGTTSFGKGIVQRIYDLTDGTCLKITTSEYFTPNGRNIHGIGIEPDIVVEYEYDDNQLERAMECLN